MRTPLQNKAEVGASLVGSRCWSLCDVRESWCPRYLVPYMSSSVQHISPTRVDKSSLLLPRRVLALALTESRWALADRFLFVKGSQKMKIWNLGAIARG